jgi:hypothetical protein
MISQRYTPVAMTSIAVTQTAVGLPGVPADAALALIVVVASTACNWSDFSTPTPTSGVPLQANAQPWEFSGDIAALKFCMPSGTAQVWAAIYQSAG